MDLIKNFIDQYEVENTKQTYKHNLNRYFRVINADPNIYFTKTRDYEKDIEQFWKNEKTYTKSVCSRNGRLNAVRQFLIENNVELPQRFWKKLKRSVKDKGNRPVTIDRTPTRYELRRIILEGKPVGRAMFLIASSSGMRIGEILKIAPEDVDFEHDPPMISIRGEYTKNGIPRSVFISSEAKEALKKWFSIRDDWIKAAVVKLQGLVKYDYSKDNRIFPFSRAFPSKIWNNMLQKANLNKRDPTTKIHVIHIHTLRKYFRTNMAKPLGLDVTEALLGHSGYLTDAYRRYSVEQLGEMYKEAEKAVSIFHEEPDLSNINRKMDEKDQQLKDLDRKYNGIKIDHIQMQLDLGKALEKIKELEKKK